MDAPQSEAAGPRQQADARWSAWMQRAQAGDEQAYQRLLEEVAGAIERFVRSRFGDGDFVEDCVQESLLAIHRARGSYDPRRRFSPWMFAIVRHKAIDLLRRRGTRGRFEVPAEGHEGATGGGGGGAALEAARLLDRLEPMYRDALVLTKLQGYSLDEAGRRAGVSASAMKTRVHRAVRQVQRLLAAEGD